MRVPGFEPGTYRVSVDCSSQLSYTRTKLIIIFLKKIQKVYSSCKESVYITSQSLLTLLATPPRLVSLRSCGRVPPQPHPSQPQLTCTFLTIFANNNLENISEKPHFYKKKGRHLPSYRPIGHDSNSSTSLRPSEPRASCPPRSLAHMLVLEFSGYAPR